MKIFWGFLITAFDFRFASFNFLPDFLGFILILMGLTECMKYSPSFERARYLSIVLIIIMIPDITELFVIDNCLFPYVWINAFWPIYAIGGILNLIMMWFILGGIRELAMEAKMTELDGDIKNLRAVYLIHGASLVSIFLFSHLSCPYLISPYYLPSLLRVIPIILVGIGIPIFVGLLYVLYEAHKIDSDLYSQAKEFI